jgi:hypothetical protein
VSDVAEVVIRRRGRATAREWRAWIDDGQYYAGLHPRPVSGPQGGWSGCSVRGVDALLPSKSMLLPVAEAGGAVVGTVFASLHVAGGVTADAAAQTGLRPGTPAVVGSGD